MEPLVLVCTGCGAPLHTARPSETRVGVCPRCGTLLDPDASLPVPETDSFGPEPLDFEPAPPPAVPPKLLLQAALLMLVSSVALIAMARSRVDQFSSVLDLPTCPEPAPICSGLTVLEAETPRIVEPQARAGFPGDSDTDPGRFHHPEPNPPPSLVSDPVAPAPRHSETPTLVETSRPPDRVRVADESGRVLIARVYGPPAFGWVLLPDGRLAKTTRLIPTSEPFVPLSREALRDQLRAGEYARFACKTSKHYLIFYQCSETFADRSSRLLDSLYEGLLKRFGDQHKFDVREAEFPLVAVIYASEDDFHARSPIQPDVQAYYEIVSNRIFFYERPGDGRDPGGLREVEANRLAALRQPQTVAHEGTHQILQNIGVQPRLADWPVWLVEGLAELAAAPRTHKGGWAGFSEIDPLNMATLHELNLLEPPGRLNARPKNQPRPGAPSFRAILTRETLSPTDYSLAWGLTLYLANVRTNDFVAYLRAMSRMEPLVDRSDAAQLAEFQRAFGPLPDDFESQIRAALGKLHFDPPTYYAVLFRQEFPNGHVLRATLVSPSPPIIRLWLNERVDPRGSAWTWQAVPYTRHDRALHAAGAWLGDSR